MYGEKKGTKIGSDHNAVGTSASISCRYSYVFVEQTNECEHTVAVHQG